jgi:hypothetical protein
MTLPARLRARPHYWRCVLLMFRPHFGIDFNAVWEPISGTESRVQPVIEGGIGGARVDLYVSQISCS